jgi:hypothetical protein
LKNYSGYQLAGIIHLGVQDARLLDDQSTVNVAQVIQVTPESREAMQRSAVKIRMISRLKKMDEES